MNRTLPGAAAAALLTALLAAALAPAALASPSSPTTAAVSMGDSYISGEAGRWNGNSITPVGDKDGTDRACAPPGLGCAEDTSRVYLGGSDPGCHRSDTAEILSASLPVAERVNIACSGAVTQNVFRAASGGRGQNGEAPQADQLLPIARAKDVKLIMLSIGGNDLGFASIVANCLARYTAKLGPCEPSQQPMIERGATQVTADVGKAIDEIRAVMAAAGYRLGDYRLVLQTYPSVVPRASEARYAELSAERTTQGCPFYDQDLTWARTKAAPEIGAVAKAAAASRRVETLDLVDALQGHEVCSKSARASTPGDRPPPAGAEWGRFVGASAVQQGDLQEAFHPNAYAQRALGDCVGKLFKRPRGRFSCTGAAGTDVNQMSLARTGGLPAADAPGCLARRLSVRRRGIGGLRLGLTRKALLAPGRPAPVMRSAKRYRYCVKAGSGAVVAVFGRRGRVDLLVTTARGHRARGVARGVSLRRARRAFPRLRRVTRRIYRTSPGSQRLIGVRGGRVSYLALASRRTLRSARALRTQLRRSGG